jgi:hypothetical protein
MKRFDRKSALKLINKYADECNRINEEKKSLEFEIKDLKANINVNKEIIDKLLNPSLTIDSKSKIILECIEKEKTRLGEVKFVPVLAEDFDLIDDKWLKSYGLDIILEKAVETIKNNIKSNLFVVRTKEISDEIKEFL